MNKSRIDINSNIVYDLPNGALEINHNYSIQTNNFFNETAEMNTDIYNFLRTEL